MRKKREAQHIAMVIDDGNPDCLHCAILKAMAEFSEKKDGQEIDKVLYSVMCVMIQIFDQVPREDSESLQDYILSHFQKHGYKWVRGPIQ